MEYRIVNLPSFSFAGVSARVPMQFEGVNKEIVKLSESITDEQKREMRRLMDIEPREIVNISYDSDTFFMKEEGYLTHMIGILTTEKDIPPILNVKPCNAGLWAVFPSKGEYPVLMQNTMANVYASWFPSHKEYSLSESLSFLFAKMDVNNPSVAYSEIWMPVIFNG